MSMPYNITLNQQQLLSPVPTLEARFPFQGRRSVRELLDIQKPYGTPPPGVAAAPTAVVLRDSLLKAVRNTSVESSVSTFEYINNPALLHEHYYKSAC